MNSSAFTVMIIAMILIWGGLLISAIHLIKNPDVEQVDDH